MLTVALVLILALVLVLPLTVEKVERNLEVFLFVMGLAAVSLSHFLGGRPAWSRELVRTALTEPLSITAAVLGAGLLIQRYRADIRKALSRLDTIVGGRWFFFLFITSLGLVSSVITVIIASIILVETVCFLVDDPKVRVRVAILGCFSIGLGAALTPLGEPLSTIFIAKLSPPPYRADFFFLLRHFGASIIPGILLVSGLVFFAGPFRMQREASGEAQSPEYRRIFLRAAKVYLFVMALVFLGKGFEPLIRAYVPGLPPAVLFWVNSVSAVVDNATLTAAEISPVMNIDQLKMALLGLLLAGGMLVPGNIPNIVAANRLEIGSVEWARLGVPLGLGLLALYFILFLVL